MAKFKKSLDVLLTKVDYTPLKKLPNTWLYYNKLKNLILVLKTRISSIISWNLKYFTKIILNKIYNYICFSLFICYSYFYYWMIHCTFTKYVDTNSIPIRTCSIFKRKYNDSIKLSTITCVIQPSNKRNSCGFWCTADYIIDYWMYRVMSFIIYTWKKMVS